MAAKETVRLSLELSQGANMMLEEVAEHNGATKAEVLRRAIALITYADSLKQRGQSLAVTDASGKLVAEVVNPW